MCVVIVLDDYFNLQCMQDIQCYRLAMDMYHMYVRGYLTIINYMSSNVK